MGRLNFDENGIKKRNNSPGYFGKTLSMSNEDGESLKYSLVATANHVPFDVNGERGHYISFCQVTEDKYEAIFYF